MCAVRDTSRRVAGARQDVQTKDGLGSLLPSSLRTRVGETSVSAVVAAAAAAAGAEGREMIPEELTPWLSGPVFIPPSLAG